MNNSYMDQQDEGGSARNNWWEGYIIRYTLGSLVGAIICWQLIGDVDDKLAIKAFISTKEEVAKYVILLLMGLCYCYVASSPMLTIHASRYRELKQTHKLVSINSIFAWLFSWTFFVGLLLWLSGYFQGDFSGKQLVYLLLGMLPPFLIFYFQYVLLPKSDADVDDLYKFYDDLSFLRYYTFTDIKTSYRHLREHGNAYSVLLLEFMLGWCLVWAIKVEVYLSVAVIVAWVLPSAFVWVVGTNIEKRYIKNRLAQAKRKHSHIIKQKKANSP